MCSQKYSSQVYLLVFFLSKGNLVYGEKGTANLCYPPKYSCEMGFSVLF